MFINYPKILSQNYWINFPKSHSGDFLKEKQLKLLMLVNQDGGEGRREKEKGENGRPKLYSRLPPACIKPFFRNCCLSADREKCYFE